jgi:hypothetical protein
MSGRSEKSPTGILTCLPLAEETEAIVKIWFPGYGLLVDYRHFQIELRDVMLVVSAGFSVMIKH